jgi:outer membrane lipopolysaccharide assembly protein LptE/RlpB
MKMIMRIGAAALAALVIWGCGYRFSIGGRLPQDAGSVFVSILENRSAETSIEHVFTNDLIYELTRNGHKIVPEDQADAVLSGVIASIQTETVSYRGQTTSLERRVTVLMNVRLTDQNGMLLWSADGISADETYGVLPEKTATEYNKHLALQSVSARIAEEVYSRLTEKF